LSDWAVHLDVPLSVVQVESVEVRTGNTQTAMLNPHFMVPLAIRPIANLQPEYRGYASLYREALNNKSGAPYNNNYCFVFRLSDHQLKEVTEYFDTELVTAALGHGEA
jgi:hypothetical protein